MIGYDDKGNQFGSPEAKSHFKNSFTTADRDARQEDHEWCVKRMRAMNILKKKSNLKEE